MDAAWDAEWFTANGGPLADEVRFRAVARDREALMWEQDLDGVVYGPPYGNLHPFDYRPDLECCTPDERAAWVAACRAAEAGEPFERGNHSHMVTPDGRIVIGGTQTNWGIGIG
jgi:hypothetical protein